MNKTHFITPIRYRIEKLLPNLVKKYSPKYPVVIDFGCGKGRYSKLFKKFKNYDYTGIDLKRKDEWGKYESKKIKYSEQDGTNLKFKDGKFNFGIVITSLEHIKNEKKAVAELYRVVKKSSYVIIIVPSKPYWLFQLGRHCYHHNSKKQLLKLVKSKPFKIVEYKSIGGLLSFLFTWFDIWLSQAIVLPFWLLRKMRRKELGSEEIEKILGNSLHWYIKFNWSKKIYFYILGFINLFDSVVRVLPNHHLIILEK